MTSTASGEVTTGDHTPSMSQFTTKDHLIAALREDVHQMRAALAFVNITLSERATYGTRAKPTVKELNEILDTVRKALER